MSRALYEIARSSTASESPFVVLRERRQECVIKYCFGSDAAGETAANTRGAEVSER